MDMAPDDHCAAAQWSLSAADLALVAGKNWTNCLSFAVLLAFCRAAGRFPRASETPEPAVIAHIARLVGVDDLGAADASDRTLKRLRAEIRGILSLREAKVADAEMLVGWLSDHAVARSRDDARLTAELEQRCRELSIEPPTPERIERIVRAAVHAYEGRLHAAVHVRLTQAMRDGLDALLRPMHPADANDAEPGAEEGRTAAPLVFLRGDPGRASVNSLREELARLAAIRAISLPADLFIRWSASELEACRQRVAVEAPYGTMACASDFKHFGAWDSASGHVGNRTSRRSGMSATADA